jgi:hypothetical protein
MESNGETPKPESGFKNFLTPAVLVTGLSLATWLFFYVESMPLTPSETTIVVGAWFIAVFLAKMLLVRVRGTKSAR